eukprot:SAG11_NODE_1426_length_4943_cov_7.372419_2_plen_46_part_00
MWTNFHLCSIHCVVDCLLANNGPKKYEARSQLESLANNFVQGYAR